jgi:hypothetical protein
VDCIRQLDVARPGMVLQVSKQFPIFRIQRPLQHIVPFLAIFEAFYIC